LGAERTAHSAAVDGNVVTGTGGRLECPLESAPAVFRLDEDRPRLGRGFSFELERRAARRELVELAGERDLAIAETSELRHVVVERAACAFHLDGVLEQGPEPAADR